MAGMLPCLLAQLVLVPPLTLSVIVPSLSLPRPISLTSYRAQLGQVTFLRPYANRRHIDESPIGPSLSHPNTQSGKQKNLPSLTGPPPLPLSSYLITSILPPACLPALYLPPLANEHCISFSPNVSFVTFNHVTASGQIRAV